MISEDVELTVEDEPAAADVAALIAGLDSHRRASIGLADDTQPIGVFVRRDGRLVAGADGRTQWGWLYVAHLWVDDELRGTGLGTRVLQAIEDAARVRGCRAVFLDTLEFQAKPFYEKLGYSEFGHLDDYPAGGVKHFLWKQL
jgi:GNAT superfamily N-acetyltransferase